MQGPHRFSRLQRRCGRHPRTDEDEPDINNVPGWVLDSSLRDDDGWMAYVRYTVAVGMQHLEWVEAPRVKAVSLEVRPKLSS
jgi:hypothetical protein